MYKDKRILGLIPARGGSKGVPRKNIREVQGKPLIAFTIEAAARSRYLDKIVTSTDDEEIAATAKKWGAEVPFMRPASLAEDGTSTMDVILHALEALPEFDVLVVLQPTSPLREARDIDTCIELAIDHECPSVSLTAATEHPKWMFYIDNEGSMDPVLKDGSMPHQRQALRIPFLLNGAVYVADRRTMMAQRSFLGKDTKGYIMPSERSLDIDTEEDMRAFELTLSGR